MTDYLANVKKYAPNASEAVVAGLVTHFGIALRSKDSSLVSCSDQAELNRVRNGFCKKKLALTDSDETIDAVIMGICAKMKEDRQKSRVTFCYLIAEKYGKLDLFVKK
jgi:Protein of unknown function (DUF2853)